MKNEFSKSVMNDNKQAFVKSRALGKSTNWNKTRNALVDYHNTSNKAKYKKLLNKK